MPYDQFSSVAQLCPTLCDPTDCIIPGFPVHHQLPELAQTHVPQVGDAIQPSFNPFSSWLQSFPASGSFPMSLLFILGDQTIGVSASALVLSMNIQGWFPLGLTTPCSSRDSVGNLGILWLVVTPPTLVRLCLCLHKAVFSLCLCVSLLFFIRTPVIGFKGHPNSG